MSVNTTRRLIANAKGMSASRCVRWYKLDKARQALERDRLSVADAAYLVGYSGPTNF